MPEPRNPLTEEFLRALPRSPDIYPHRIDFNSMAVFLLRLSAERYRSASFLDDRILGPSSAGIWLPCNHVADALRLAPPSLPVHFICHTGHVGSTLVSRLLDETGSVLSIREPLPLRSLAEAHDVLARPESLLSQAQFGAAMNLLMRLWGRGYPAVAGVVVKATSSAARLAGPILARAQSSRAIYMNLRAEPYLAALLAGENSAVDLRGHGPERMRRLQSRLATSLSPLHTLSLGELAAMSWLAESLTQRDAVTGCSARMMAIDFDEFLSSVVENCRRILAHFQLPYDEARLAGLGANAVLSRYSKAPEYAFTAASRAEILRDSRRRNRKEIERGMAWLEQRARSHPAVAELLNGA